VCPETDILTTVQPIDVKFCTTVDLSSVQVFGVDVFIGVSKRETKKEGVGFGASKKPFDREYIESGKSQCYTSIGT